MALYTRSYLKDLSQNMPPGQTERMISEAKETYSFDIYLSHSDLDRDEVNGLFIELTKMGFSVYVDWIVDPDLDRSSITKETATIIRNRLKASKTLLVAIAGNGLLPGWMPWEVGFVDGHTELCAIVPVAEDASASRSFKVEAYLSLYPFISKEINANNVEHLWVIEESNKYVQFERWLLGAKPFSRTTDLF